MASHGTEEHVKRISELEERLKDVEEDLEAHQDLVDILSISLRNVSDELQSAEATVLQSRMLHKYGNSEIGVKSLGERNTEGWFEVCKDKFDTREAFDVWVSEIDYKLRKHTFTLTKIVPDGEGGKMKIVVNEDDKTLTMLRKQYGPLVANSVGATALEIVTWNPSGRFGIQMPWDFKANKKATMSQIFEHFTKVLKDKQSKRTRTSN